MNHNQSQLLQQQHRLQSGHELDTMILLPTTARALLCSNWTNTSDCGINNTFYNIHYSNESTIMMDSWPLERIVSAVVPVFFGIIGFAGLLGNALVIIVVGVNQQMRSTTNLLIINLAVSDILFVIFCVPFTATDYVLTAWPFGNLWCKFVQYMIVVTCHCSVYTLVLMSFDRFLAVVHPVTSMALRTERNAALAILMAWILIVTTAIPVALAHSEQIHQIDGRHYINCVFSSDQEMWSLLWFQCSFFVSSYVAPLTLISFLYMGMLARLWRTTPGSKPLSESRRKRRVTRMVVIVVLAFAVCWLPIHVSLYWLSIGGRCKLVLWFPLLYYAFYREMSITRKPSNEWPPFVNATYTEKVVLVLKALDMYKHSHFNIVIQIIAHIMAYINSCINPILYAFLSENFRKAFRKVVWCGNSKPVQTNLKMMKATRIGTTTATATATATATTTANGNGASNIEML